MTADINTVFCTAQNVSGNGTTVASTDWLDWKVAQDIAGGPPPAVEIIVTTSFTGGTSVRFRLAAVDSAGANPEVLDETPDIAIANLVTTGQGRRITLNASAKNALPTSTKTHLRLYAINTGNNSAGSISAQLVGKSESQHPNKSYAAGY